MSRVIAEIQVADPAFWAEIEAALPGGLAPFFVDAPAPDRRRVADRFVRDALPQIQKAGLSVLVRAARRDPAEVEALREEHSARIQAFPINIQRVLYAAQRHALDDVVIGLHAWDPVNDAPAVRALHGAGLITSMQDGSDPYLGRYRLARDLPPPPEIRYDLEEAAMDETDDLSRPDASPIELLHDMAALAAALQRLVLKRTVAGGVARADGKRLGAQLGDPGLSKDGDLATHPRWSRAMRALDALGAVATDPLSREIYLDLGLEAAIAGSTRDAMDRLVHRLVDRDLHGVVPAIRAALKAAGPGAVDELIFFDLVREQHRDLLFPVWRRAEGLLYPAAAGETARPYDDDGWERVEVPLIKTVLKRLEHLGAVRRAPGVFGATEDGRIWAGALDPTPSPMWARSDLELMVPPDAVTPWERFQIERLGRCLGRDVVNRYKLERDALARWLCTHELDEALALLRRRCPGVPAVVEDTLKQWARSATRIVLTQGILLEE